MVILYFLIMIFLIIINYFSHRKLELFLWLFALGLTWFLSVFVNADYVDWGAYQSLFEKSVTFETAVEINKDVGFAGLLFLLNRMGFPAITLRIVIFTLGFLLMHISLRKCNVNKLIFITMYAIFPLTSDVMHLRTYIVSFLLFYATVNYFTDKNWIKFVAFVLIAAAFHKMAIFYLPMMLVNKMTDKSRLIKILFAFVVITLLVIGSNRSFVEIIINLLLSANNTINLGNYTNYLGANIKYGWIVDWTVQLLILGLLMYIKKESEKGMLRINKSFVNIVFWANVYAIIFMPFYMISFDYFRLFRNVLPIDYLCFCMYLQSFSVERNIMQVKVKQVIATVVFITFIISLSYVKVGYRGRADEEFFNFFNNEHIIKDNKY